jgi:hypothetical protein
MAVTLLTHYLAATAGAALTLLVMVIMAIGTREKD